MTIQTEKVTVCFPAVIGECAQCKSPLTGTDNTTRDLPKTHPGSALDPPRAISFAIWILHDGMSVGCAVICFSCALQYDEIHGFWKGTKVPKGTRAS